jgi:hypothetical protein
VTARRLQALQGEAPLFERPVDELNDAFKSLLLSTIRRQAVHGQAQLHGRREETLKHRVMQFLRDARPLIRQRLRISYRLTWGCIGEQHASSVPH